MTNFLDDHPQDWTNPEYEELCDYLVAVAGREGRLTLQQLAESAGIAVGTFPGGYASVRTTATELIKEMGRQGKLRALVEAASRLPTVYAEQLRALLTRPARSGPPISGRSVPAPAPPAPLDLGDIPLHKVRDLLMEAFNAEDLRRIFLYSANPTLQALTKRFGSRDGLADMVDTVLPYCRQHVLIPELLAEVEKANPRRYARWLAQL